MIHETIGNLGHLSAVVAFVSALVATFAYVKTTLTSDLAGQADWRRLARGAFYVHGASVLSIVGTLFWIVYNHYFEYHYAWNHSNLALPKQYVIAAFWNGQEGSFLLWIFWNVVIGVILTRRAGTWEGPVLTIVALVQAFLMSMILGVVFGGTFKVGSSPFTLLRDAMPDAPVFAMNPNFIPKDGSGMSPLLQNYWMVIHPPTLFLGFGLTLVPFAYCLAGLWRNQPTQWIKPALPWALLCAVILGVGILMGGYWAYETLNFGGYWNWDPVENAVYVPWLVLVASIHTLLIGKRSSTALKTAVILTVAQFVLILYSTFLTRSGILGNASVHSFTDLGLSGQLLLYLLVFLGLSVALMVVKWKIIPSDKDELTVYSGEFWLFVGALVLCLASFQVIATTSIPVYNKIFEAFGKVSSLAPPADQVAHYNKFQIWFFVVIALLTGIGQYVWYRRVKSGDWQAVMTPVILTLFITAGLIAAGKIRTPSYMILLTAATFSVVANATILLSVWQKTRQAGKSMFSGGAVAHIGMALMLIGVLYSSGYSRVISLNNTGLLISRDESFTRNDNKENKENMLLWLNQPERMGEYQLTYRGQRVEGRDVPGYFPSTWVELIEGDFHGVAKQDIVQNGKTYYRKGDTLAMHPENVYYEIEYREPDGKVFTLYPRVQASGSMGTAFSPDIQRKAGRDLYTYIAQAPNFKTERTWSKTETYTAAIKDTFFLNDQIAILDGVSRTTDVPGVDLKPTDVAVKAQVRILDKEREVLMQPAFIISNGLVARPADVSDELGVRLELRSIDPKTGQFTFAANRTQRDYIVMKALEKPFINVLWLGTAVLVLGFSMATVKRFREGREKPLGERKLKKVAVGSRQ